ncbi:low temperature requirement protein A [Streptomyces sp. NPDC001194]|uniref:low temperature requirement protein A n=1 Tax=Streptomyces sp. NPDC001194 TaxID=3364547 RepID=UPI00367EFE5E
MSAFGDAGLRRQVAVSWSPVLASSGLLIAGATVDGGVQTALFAATIAVDWGGVYLTSRRGNWLIHSAAYFTERHGLFVILVLSESLAVLGAGVAEHPIGTPLVIAAMLATPFSGRSPENAAGVSPGPRMCSKRQ